MKTRFQSFFRSHMTPPSSLEDIMRRSVRESMTTEAMATFTGGAFIVAFALHLGASNLVIGILAGIPPLMQLLQFPAVLLIEKVRRRKFLYTLTAFIGRLHWLVAAMIPFFWPNRTGLIIFLLGFIFRGIFLSVSNLSLISLLRDIVPQDRLGQFFGKRMQLASGVAIVLSLAAGLYIDTWARAMPEHAITAYSLLFFLGFLFGLVSIYFVTGLPEPPMDDTRTSLRHILAAPFKDIEFRRLMIFLGSWNFAINLAAPFFTVYMLKRIGLDMRLVISLWVISQLVSMLFMRRLGTLADRFSNKTVIMICAPAFLLCFIAWTFTTTPEPHYYTIPLLIIIHLVMGFSMAGTGLAGGNIVLKLAPKGSATAYIAARTMVNSIAAGCAPIIGGLFADFFSVRELTLSITWNSPITHVTVRALHLSHWDFFFLLACILGYFSLHLLRKVKEVGEVEEGIVIGEIMHDMRRELRNFSTVGGLRNVFHFPIFAMKNSRHHGINSINALSNKEKIHAHESESKISPESPSD